jgi:TRAP-type C4-dicarboxylate transport system permease small subunit
MSDDAKDPPAPAKDAPPSPKPWGDKLLAFDKAWTRLDTRLCTIVLVSQIVLLALWATLNSLTRDYTKGNASAIVIRILLTLASVGAVAYIAQRVKRARAANDAGLKWVWHALRIVPLLFLVYVTLRSWGASSAAYTSNLLTWLQGASTLTFLGGLRGLVTKLTLWVALLGASIATSNGKHINVDLVVRLLKPKMRIPAAVASSVAAILVCVGALVAFVDSIAIAQFHAPDTQPCTPGSTEFCETPAGVKFAIMKTQLRKDMFLVGRQISLDMISLPKVVAGVPYDKYMTPVMWNEWMRGGDWGAFYSQEAINGQMLDEKDAERRRQPVVNVPGGAEATFGLLAREMNFIFPFGMLMIALRFIVRLLLVISGHRTVDPDAVHGDEEIHQHAGAEPDVHASEGGAS